MKIIEVDYELFKENLVIDMREYQIAVRLILWAKYWQMRKKPSEIICKFLTSTNTINVVIVEVYSGSRK